MVREFPWQRGLFANCYILHFYVLRLTPTVLVLQLLQSEILSLELFESVPAVTLFTIALRPTVSRFQQVFQPTLRIFCTSDLSSADLFACLQIIFLYLLSYSLFCFGKIQIGVNSLTFWYRLKRVVPDKGLLNGCFCCYFAGFTSLDLEDVGTDGKPAGGDDDAEGLRRLVSVSRRQFDELQVSARGTRTPAVGTHRNRSLLPQC